MARKFKKWFEFFDTEAEAIAFCDRENRTGSYYKRTHYKAIYTPWTSLDGTEHKYIAWTYI